MHLVSIFIGSTCAYYWEAVILTGLWGLFTSTFMHSFDLFKMVTYVSGGSEASLILIFLSLWTVLVSLNPLPLSSSAPLLMKKNKLILLLLAALYGAFTSLSLLSFYFFFEASLIPILILILGWGYQPERLLAGWSLLFYTFIASLPLLLCLASLQSEGLEWSTGLNLENTHVTIEKVFTLALVLAFLVKLPIYSLHVWLPQAHVEAPVEGSMLLAAILLKLGGYGLFLVLPIIEQTSWISWSLIILALWGGCLAAIISTTLVDLKMVVAYSSIAHMAATVGAMILSTHLGIYGTFVIFVSHGVVSSGLFSGVNEIYKSLGSRNLVMNQGLLSLWPIFSLVWFILIMGNMGSPPTPNLMGEITMFLCLASSSSWLLIFLSCIAFFSCIFSLNMFLLTCHPQNNSSNLFGMNQSMVTLLNLGFHSFWVMVGGIYVFWMI